MSDCRDFLKWAALLNHHTISEIYILIEQFPSEISRLTKFELHKTKTKIDLKARNRNFNGMVGWPKNILHCMDNLLQRFSVEEIFPGRSMSEAIILATIAEYLSAESYTVPDDPDLREVKHLLRK